MRPQILGWQTRVIHGSRNPMKSPLRIWTLYALCVLLAVPALSWLSWHVVRLDRAREIDRQQTELARQEAELQERISSALWRMDGMLAPLVAQEAARPYYLYEPFYRSAQQPIANEAATGDDASTRETPSIPSPLLISQSEFVHLHFQIDPENAITSPQRPVGVACEQAMTCCGLSLDAIDRHDDKLQQLKYVLDYETLVAKCPVEKLPTLTESPDASDSLPSSPLQNFVEPAPMFGAASRAPESQTENQGLAPDGAAMKQQMQISRNTNRGNDEFNRRAKSIGQYAQTEWSDNMFNSGGIGPAGNALTPDAFVSEGIMRPLWMGGELFLARRVEGLHQRFVQGCWLNLEVIEDRLRDEVADLLPGVGFQPIVDATDAQLGRALATLPLQLNIDRSRIIRDIRFAPPGDADATTLGVHWAIGVAWGCLGLVAIAGALLLNGLIKLSERRGAFVSAVTHELRTPLTTFRMYAEMLAERMIPSPDKQQQYAETMRREADRLYHLVENVLQFARLERSARGTRKEQTSWDQLLSRFLDRLQQRSDQGNMDLVVTMSDTDRQRVFETDPAALEQILFNLVDNACKYARDADDRRIQLAVAFSADRLKVSVRDYGPGVDSVVRKRMFQPFSKSDQTAADTAQGVGLGLALCRRMAASLGGTLTLGDASPGAEMILQIPV